MSTDRHDPLDADERELARVLRALPAGEPPSALDARILAMARDAVVTTPVLHDEARPRRAPRFAWGLGVAASCVLAAGLVWRMGGFGGESLDVVGSAVPQEAETASAAAQPAPPLPEAEPEHITVEIGGVRSTPRATLQPPPPPPPEAPARQQRSETERLRALRENLGEQRREQAPAFAPAPAPEAAPAADAMMAAPAPAPAAAPLSATSAEAQGEVLDRIEVTGSRINPDVARPVAEDGKAGAQTWLRRIRARIAAGDEEGARESLEGFIERHPGKPLPQDLIDFRTRSSAE